MSINLDQIQAITEYVRQRKLLSKDLGPVVHGVFSDPEAEMADLTVDHLEALLAYARDLKARLGRVEAIHFNEDGLCGQCANRYPCSTIRAALTATDGQA